MKNIVLRMMFFIIFCSATAIIFSGCKKDKKDNGVTTLGYAPNDVSGMEMNFSGKIIHFSSNSSCSVSSNSGVVQSSPSPSCKYEKTGEYSATLEFTYTYRYYHNIYGFEYPYWEYDCVYQLSLNFISPNEGYASGQYIYTGDVISGSDSGSETISYKEFTIF